MAGATASLPYSGGVKHILGRCRLFPSEPPRRKTLGAGEEGE